MTETTTMIAARMTPDRRRLAEVERGEGRLVDEQGDGEAAVARAVAARPQQQRLDEDLEAADDRQDDHEQDRSARSSAG